MITLFNGGKVALNLGVKIFLIFSFLVVSYQFVFSKAALQPSTIDGVVVNSGGNPLSGVNIFNKQIQTVSNSGEFEISAQEGEMDNTYMGKPTYCETK